MPSSLNSRRMTMEDENSILPPPKRTPWNKGKLIGAKPPLVDQELELGRLINRDVTRFGPFEDLVHVIGHAPEQLREIDGITYQRLDVIAAPRPPV
jgi:hypothetical protein